MANEITREQAEAAVNTAKEQVATLEAERTMIDTRLRDLESEVSTLRKRRDAIECRAWKGADGELPLARAALAEAECRRADMDAPNITSDEGNHYVLISVGPKQVKVRFAGKVNGSTWTLTRKCPQSAHIFRALKQDDLDGAVTAFLSTKTKR